MLEEELAQHGVRNNNIDVLARCKACWTSKAMTGFRLENYKNLKCKNCEERDPELYIPYEQSFVRSNRTLPDKVDDTDANALITLFSSFDSNRIFENDVYPFIELVDNSDELVTHEMHDKISAVLGEWAESFVYRYFKNLDICPTISFAPEWIKNFENSTPLPHEKLLTVKKDASFLRLSKLFLLLSPIDCGRCGLNYFLHVPWGKDLPSFFYSLNHREPELKIFDIATMWEKRFPYCAFCSDYNYKITLVEHGDLQRHYERYPESSFDDETEY